MAWSAVTLSATPQGRRCDTFSRMGDPCVRSVFIKAAIDRVMHRSVILEFDVPNYRTDAAQQQGQAEEVNRQK